MPPAIQRFFAFIIVLAIGIKEWLTKDRTPPIFVRLALFVVGLICIWLGARLFAYPQQYAAPTIRDFAGILAMAIAAIFFAFTFPRGWMVARRILGF